VLKLIFLGGVVAISLYLFGSNPSTAKYNVYFWFPQKTQEHFLGVVNGLDACGSVAHAYAQSKSLSRSDDWSYICCMKTSTSECAEKHR